MLSTGSSIKAVANKLEQYKPNNIVIDIALSVNATDVHIGQNDIPASNVRKIIGKHMLLGVSVSSVQEALQAENDGADYLGVGAMFPTETKTDAKSCR